METIAETGAGRVEGREKDGILLFAGVPYAAAPIGDLRFREPQAHPGWTGVRETKRFGPVSVQGGTVLGGLVPGRAQNTNEDCLFLNVQTPALDRGRRPVMVWLHGGSFVGGSGSTPWYNGVRFVTHGDVVCVTLNYRLGALGYLYLGEHDGSRAVSGNSGLLDQIAALTWVRDNIEHFGGDPTNVTLFGESAGGMSVGTILGTPRASGLFHKAIPQSGAAHNTITAGSAAEVTDRMLRALEVATVDELVALPADQVYDAQVAVSAEVLATRLTTSGKPDLGLAFGPMVDGVVLPQRPIDAIREGQARDVALLTGTTRDEWNLFDIASRSGLDDDALERRARRLFDGPSEAVQTYRRNRPEAPPDDLWSAMMTDRVFRVPAIRLAEAQSAFQPRTFMYHFTWATPAFDGRLGSCHALEIPFVFDNLEQAGVPFLTGGAAPQSLADAMHRSWLSFVHTADPSHDAIPEWPAYDVESRATMVFDETSELTFDPAGDERALWDGEVI